MKNILCVKWGNKYSNQYVENLYNMCKRNVTYPFRFICLSDELGGLSSNVEVKKLERNFEGWWTKLEYFKDPLYDVEGTILALDLDLVIIDNIDCFFDTEGEFCIEKDFVKDNGNNSSVMRFEANKHSDISELTTHKTTDYWGDQEWITEKRPNATHWPSEWIKSYKWECLNGNKLDIPAGTKIIMYHGKPDPHETLQHIGEWWK